MSEFEYRLLRAMTEPVEEKCPCGEDKCSMLHFWVFTTRGQS